MILDVFFFLRVQACICFIFQGGLVAIVALFDSMPNGLIRPSDSMISK